MFRVVPFEVAHERAWNAFVEASRNGTFLFHRNYMDYHASRFIDASVLVFRDEQIVAVIPATRDGDRLVSHGGLTYGGVIVGDGVTLPTMIDVFAAWLDHLQRTNVKRVLYKTMPSIYPAVPSEEDRFILWRLGAVATRRDVLSVVVPAADVRFQERRRRAIRRAAASNLQVQASNDFSQYWDILAASLARHGVSPVHRIEEIVLLAGRFPDRIRLYATMAGTEMLAGVVVYDTGRVAHAQYIAATTTGREMGALDFLFDALIRKVYVGKSYFDFGASTESAGQVLNFGLVEQKEGFAARTIVHDQYELRLDQL